MDIKKLAELLVESSEIYSQARCIPWWQINQKTADEFVEYNCFPPKIVKEVNTCVAECGKEELLSPVGQGGFTLFHLLVWHNFYDAVEGMLRNEIIGKEAIDLTDHSGQGVNPFLLACAQGNLIMVKLLLEYGANVSFCDKRGRNAFHFLAYPDLDILEKNLDCLEQSVDQRGELARLLTCDINLKNEEGLTPLEYLLSHEYNAEYTWPLTEIFLEKGAKTDYVDEDGNTLLMLARRHGHITAALQLMKNCPELLDVENKAGMNPIRHAVEYRNMAMYFALLEHGAAKVPDACMEMFPLSQITSNAYCKVSDENRDALSLALYLTAKMISRMDPDDEDEVGEISELLHNALIADKEGHLLDVCREMKIDFTMPIYYKGEMFCLRDECLHSAYGITVLKKLMEMGVDMNRAVIGGRTPAAIIALLSKRTYKEEEVFFEEAAELFSKESMEQTDNHGRAAIHYAAKSGHAGMLQVMIKKGVNIDLTQDEPGDAGATALHCACEKGHEDVVRLLISAGADDTLANIDGETPAHYVVKEKSFGSRFTTEQTAGLLKTLKNIDIPREDGRTPLMLLKDFGTDNELLKLFLDRGADVNHADQNGVTLLMLHTEKDSAKELIQAGADVNLADDEGNTALHYALECYSEGSARYLIKKGADYNRYNNQGVTPAQLAAEKGMDMALELMTDIR